ncbi:hypothetical protein BJ508DRAFT_315160 [Ascobolus immersus RN42]|uniref:Uncharacterized protein n=1 Tax=Ascobolus immersus RN42 TaxID=1160509 RepID=A0A3N4HFJ9_ASCIM|nr:hypothetical protein BJ508DRAFT_315160 [Ascobolus immersus RN42]
MLKPDTHYFVYIVFQKTTYSRMGPNGENVGKGSTQGMTNTYPSEVFQVTNDTRGKGTNDISKTEIDKAVETTIGKEISESSSASNSSRAGLSSGAIGGIAGGVVATLVILLAIVGVYMLGRHRERKKPRQPIQEDMPKVIEAGTQMGEESASGNDITMDEKDFKVVPLVPVELKGIGIQEIDGKPLAELDGKSSITRDPEEASDNSAAASTTKGKLKN